ncbi:MAG: ABC transporter substrate-binding protein [Bacillota bacterium]
MRVPTTYKRIFCTLLSLLLALSTVACSAKTQADTSAVLNLYGVPSFIKEGKTSFPWLYISVTNFCYRTLFITEADDTGIYSDLVKEYEISDDRLRYSLTLKDDLIWSDDETLDLDDVVFSMESVLKTDQVNSMFSTTFSYIKGAEEYMKGEAGSISGLVRDGERLHIELEKPMYSFLAILAQFAILPEHALNIVPISEIHNCDFWLDPVVSGMYKRGEHVPNEYLTYAYNENYGGVMPEIKTLLMRSDFALEEIDYTTTSNVEQILSYRSIPSMKEYDVSAVFYRYLLFKDVKNGIVDPVMNDPNLRKAILHAIDTESILNHVYYSSGSLLNKNSETYNLEEAKRILEEVGYDFNRPLVILTPFVDSVSIDLIEAIAGDLEKVGFTVTPIFGGNIYNDSYDIALNDLSAIDEFQWYMEFDQTNALRQNNFADAEAFDVLIDELLATTNEEERAEKINELELLSNDLVYKFPLLTMNHKAYINKYKIAVPSTLVFGNARYRYNMHMEDWIFVS